MTFLIVIIATLIVFYIPWVAVSISTHGLAKDDELICMALSENMSKGIRVNSLNRDIITVGKMSYIASAL